MVVVHYLIASNGASLTLVMSPLLLLLLLFLLLLLLIAGPVLLPAHRVHCEYLMMLQLKQRDMGKCVQQQTGGDSAVVIQGRRYLLMQNNQLHKYIHTTK